MPTSAAKFHNIRSTNSRCSSKAKMSALSKVEMSVSAPFWEFGCVSAWNKDPLFGVIGIQSGPRDKGPQWLPSSHGSRGWDAGGGDDCEDPSRLFCSWSADQGDLPRAWRIAQGGPQGHPFGGDGVPVRARDAAASEDGPVECRA